MTAVGSSGRWSAWRNCPSCCSRTAGSAEMASSWPGCWASARHSIEGCSCHLQDGGRSGPLPLLWGWRAPRRSGLTTDPGLSRGHRGTRAVPTTNTGSIRPRGRLLQTALKQHVPADPRIVIRVTGTGTRTLRTTPDTGRHPVLSGGPTSDRLRPRYRADRVGSSGQGCAGERGHIAGRPLTAGKGSNGAHNR